MDEDNLRSKLKQATLIIGEIESTSKEVFQTIILRQMAQ